MIVILAILIGVIIGGIYQWVNKAKINTDINNAKQLDSALSTALTMSDDSGGVYDTIYKLAKNKTWVWYWTDEVQLELTDKYSFGIHVYYDIEKTICDTLDKLPKSQTGKGFCFYIYWDKDGLPSTKVFALADENVPYDLSYFNDKKGLTDISWYPQKGFYQIIDGSFPVK